MTKNPILDELHAVREQLLADAGGTLDALVDQLQVEEQQSKRPRFASRHKKTSKSDECGSQTLVSPPGDR
ncbi:MAG: hypothetical protein R3C18_20885 [Planctomycetaceae bacterium]